MSIARTPNLAGGRTAPRGVLQFNLVHRFTLSEAPLRKVTNTPTFEVTFDDAGSYPYYCAVHRSLMTGTVVAE
jgi:plastocyanin